jgi:hypothetical protein
VGVAFQAEYCSSKHIQRPISTGRRSEARDPPLKSDPCHLPGEYSDLVDQGIDTLMLFIPKLTSPPRDDGFVSLVIEVIAISPPVG